MSDSRTTIQKLRDALKEFRDRRDWARFHDPKNIAEAISIEAGELMENFLWKDINKIKDELVSNPKFREEIEEELADILSFCFHFANATDIDISEAIFNKMKKVDEKYPIEKSKGNAIKYNKF